ncbi:MAG: ATP-binding protein [Bacteroidota bacterium]
MRIISHSILWVLVFAVVWVSGQPVQSNWKEINPSSSQEAFEEAQTFFRESYQWDLRDQITYLKQLQKAAKIYGTDSMVVRFSEPLAYVYMDADSVAQAFAVLNEALTYSHEPAFRGVVYNGLGILYSDYMDFDASLEYYFKAVEESKRSKDGSEAYPIGNISQVYANLGDYENAIKYLRYSIGFSQAMDPPEKEYSLVFDYSMIADFFLEIEKEDSSTYYSELAIEAIRRIDTIQERKFREACFSGWANLTGCAIKKGDTLKAKQYLEEALNATIRPEYAHQIEAKYHVFIKDYEAAITILEGEVLEKIDAGKEEVLALKVECYKGMGDFAKAVEVQEEWIAYQAEFFGQNRLRYSAFADVKYETIRKEEEIKSLRLKQEVQELTIENQRFAVSLNALLAILLAGGAIFLWQRYRNRNRLNQYLQEQVDLKTQDLRKANDDLKVLSFVASHDLKEPINNIRNYVGLIENKIPEVSKSNLSFFFEIIHNSIGQVYTLLEDLAKYLILTNGESVETTLVDLDKLTDEVFLSLDSYVQARNGELINGGLPELYTNSSLIQVVLKNLVENGLKFNQSSIPSVEVRYEETPNEDHIIVSDNGIGIEAEFYGKIFENFKRLHNRDEYEGSGMGLAIVKLLVEKLGGSILLESTMEKGSTFTIAFPKGAVEKLGERVDLINPLRSI